MPLVRENCKVLACSVVSPGPANATQGSAVRISAPRRVLEPVNPAAAALFGGGGSRRAFGWRRSLGGTAQNAIGEAGIGALHVLLVGLQIGANGGIGVLHSGMGQEQLL